EGGRRALVVVLHREDGARAVAHHHDRGGVVEQLGVGAADVEAAEAVGNARRERQGQQRQQQELAHQRRLRTTSTNRPSNRIDAPMGAGAPPTRQPQDFFLVSLLALVILSFFLVVAAGSVEPACDIFRSSSGTSWRTMVASLMAPRGAN